MPLCKIISKATKLSKMIANSIYLFRRKLFPFIIQINVLFVNSSARKENPALYFLIKLLILAWAMKGFFFLYNYTITAGWEIRDVSDIIKILGWSFLYDGFCISLLVIPLLFILVSCRNKFKYKPLRITTWALFAVIFSLFILLNTVDIFYYRFHMQRADADMLFVLRNPFADGTYKIGLMIVAIFLFMLLVTWYFYRQLDKLMISGHPVRNSLLLLLLPVFFVSMFLVTGTKKILPTYPLTNLNPTQLPLVQNSLHTFLYSLYRRKETTLPAKKYMPLSQQKAIFQIEKKNSATIAPKNIVLFIMESIPLDFFDSNSLYKVPMPFLDSLVRKSTFYSNAFSYSYNSNKGITAILSGLPTITDIPLYHANYTSIKRTSVGSVLKKNGYQSAFFIGDNYDDFGFAKCSRWLGIEQYYSMEAIPGYKKMEKHSMGLHDEFVLNFMQKKLKKMQPPFFAVQYNVSTHYPNDVPTSFKNKYPHQKGTPQMLSMLYYNNCLQQFFDSIRSEPWYKNTVFIFCSDHWAQPQYDHISMDKVESFRIPLFIYEPGNEKGSVVTPPVSQFDIVNTMLYYGGIGESFISYGSNLNDTGDAGRTVFCKTNAAIYQAINAEYVLGFNAIEGTPVYCYAYKKDPEKKNNLLLQPVTADITRLTLQMKAFLQTAVSHYRGEL